MLNDVRYSGYLAYRLLNACVKEGEYAKRRGYQMIIGISDWTVRGRWHYFELLLPENAEKQSERPEKQILSLEKIGVKPKKNDNFKSGKCLQTIDFTGFAKKY